MGTNFFDFKERVTAPKKPKTAKPLSSDAGATALTVTQLTTQIDRVLRAGFPTSVLLKGELSNYRPHIPSGHLYFTLKDAGACIDCVMWKSDAVRLRFTPADGMELLARGNVQVFGQKGKYQLYATSLQPLGQGALELAFQQMRAKLEADGLFAADRKRPLPRYPTRIVLVTSSQTAALADMLKVLRRFPWLRLMLYNVPVQGDGCGGRIAEALNHLGHFMASVCADVVLLARGGGSLEDLWGFNEEAVARAVARCPVPVVTGIGHEVDTSIADLVADYHAHTPTEAAQVITTHWRAAPAALASHAIRLQREARGMLQHARQRLLGCERHELFRRPLHRVMALRQLVDDRELALVTKINGRMTALHRRLDQLGARLRERHPRNAVSLATGRLDGFVGRLHGGIATFLQLRQHRLDAIAKHLLAVSPDEVLRRGYSITTRTRDGLIVRQPEDVRAGERLTTRVAGGEIDSVVKDPNQPELFE